MIDLEVDTAVHPASEVGPSLLEVTDSSPPIVLIDDLIEYRHIQLPPGTNASEPAS